MIVGDVTNDVKKDRMLAVSVYVCLPLCENVLSTSLHIAIQTIYSVLEDLPLFFFFLVLLLYFYYFF